MKRILPAGLLILAVVAGCNPGTDNSNPGSIALTLSASTGSVARGSQILVTASVIRAGSFTGDVNLTVTGAPAGVTTPITDVVTAGSLTIATVTFRASATAAAGVYPLIIHAMGTGVTESTAAYQLTVVQGGS